MSEILPTTLLNNHRSLFASTVARLKDYWTLTKPEVNFLVVASTFAGFYLANRGPINWARLLSTLLGTFLVASGTATLNQFYERRHDANMRRTSYRPLPAGRLAARDALWFGIVISIVGGVYLWLAINLLASVLAISTLVSYLFVYTPMKRRTALCTAVGAVPGAMPPLIGWAAARGALTRESWLLFAILFLWQFPHFLSIAWMYRDDYARAGFRMLPKSDEDGRFTAREILLLTVALVAVTLVPALLHYEGRIYLLGALVAGAFFIYESIRLAAARSTALARRMLHLSVIYLPLIIGLMVISKTSW